MVNTRVPDILEELEKIKDDLDKVEEKEKILAETPKPNVKMKFKKNMSRVEFVELQKVCFK